MKLDELHEKHHKLSEGEIILDVRGKDEHEEVHIPSSICIPHTEVADHVDELKAYKKVYIHCKRGGRAKVAYESLKAAGLENIVCVDDAGMDVWVEKGYPTQKS